MKRIRRYGVAAKRSVPRRDVRLGNIKRSMMSQVVVVEATWSSIELVTRASHVRI